MKSEAKLIQKNYMTNLSLLEPLKVHEQVGLDACTEIKRTDWTKNSMETKLEKPQRTTQEKMGRQNKGRPVDTGSKKRRKNEDREEWRQFIVAVMDLKKSQRRRSTSNGKIGTSVNSRMFLFRHFVEDGVCCCIVEREFLMSKYIEDNLPSIYLRDQASRFIISEFVPSVPDHNSF